MNNTQRQYSKVSQGADKLLQKRIRSNVPTKNIADKENTQKNLQKTNPRMASARANPRQDKQSIKNQEQLLQQQQLQISQQMLQMGNMGVMLPGFGMPQQQMIPSMPNMQAPVGLDVHNQIAALQQQIRSMHQMQQYQAQLAQLQNQVHIGYPQFMPGQIGVQPVSADPLLQIANQIQYHDVQQTEGSKKTSPQKPSASKKNSKKAQTGVKQTSERQSPDNDRFGSKRVDPVVLQAENLPVARTTRSGRPIENSPVKSTGKNAGIAAPKSVGAAKFEKRVPTQPNSQGTQGTIGTLRSSNKTPAKGEIQNELIKKASKNTVPAAKPTGVLTKPNKHQKIEGENGIVRRSTRFSGVKEELVALEDVFGNKTNSPIKKATQPKSKYVDESSESIQDKSDTSSNLPVRRSIRHRASPPKETPLRETRHSNRVTTRDSQKTTSLQSQGNENKNEDSAILQQLKNQLLQTEMEYTSKIAANKERDMKKEKRNNSSETRKIQKAKQAYRPPTKDEMMLFGDVLLNNKNNKEQVSEFDTVNPLETGGQHKYEAQTEIIMKNEKLIEEQEFTDDEDDKAIRSQLEKEKEAFKHKENKVIDFSKEIDQSKIQDMGILFGMKDDEVKDFAQKQQSTLQTLKDESILFGEPVKPEIFAQQQQLSQSVKNEQQQLSEQILVTEENSKSQNVLNLISQQDQEMKNESVGPKSQDPENTVSDHEESGQKENVQTQIVEQKVFDEQQMCTPVKDVAMMHASEAEEQAPTQEANKISDLDRQIAEIKKAIAIQQEVTNRKLNEQAQKEQEEKEQAEREEAAKIAAAASAAAAEQERVAAFAAAEERARLEAEAVAEQERATAFAAAEERARLDAEAVAEQERAAAFAAAEERARLENEAASAEAARAQAAYEEEQKIKRIHEENIREAERQMAEKREEERLIAEKKYAEEQLAAREAEIQANAEKARRGVEEQELREKERQEQEIIRLRQEQQEQLKQQELARLRYVREHQLKQEEQRKQYEALLEQKRKTEAENLRRQQAELAALQEAQAQAVAEEKRKQDQMQEYNKLIQERNKIEQQEQMVKQQLAVEQRKKVERLEQQHQEARLQLAEEQKKKAEREKAAAAQAQKEQEQIEKQKEIEERARLLQIAENPSTEQHQIEIISDSMQDESDLQYGYENIHAEPISYQLSENLIENIQLSEEYSLLLKFQQSIDQSIGFNIQRSQNTSFAATKFFVEESLKRQFKQSHFQKILYVAHEFYNHRWEMKLDKPELVITIPKNAAEINQFGAEPSLESYSGPISSNLQSQRSRLFKMKLVQIMVDHFQNFKARNPQLQNFNIHNTHKWPSSFDIEDKQLVPEIPLSQLKELPKTKPKTTINDFISVHDHQKNFQQAAKDALEKDQEMRNQEQGQILEHVSDRDSSEEDRIKGDKMINKTGFSQATMDAIQFKQSIETEKKQKSQDIIDSQSQQSSQNLLIKASDQIKSIFTIQQGQTMFLLRLQNNMMDQHRGNFVSKDHVLDLITQLTKIVPEWLCLKSHPQGKLVKCHKNLNLSHYNIRQKIEDYFRNDIQDKKYKIETNSQEMRLSKSCPPPASSSANNQKQSQGSNSGFKNFSAFQPFQRKQSFNNNDPDSLRKNETIQIESRNSSSINKNNFGINQGNSSISISGQGPFNRNYPDSNLQYQTAQIQPSSSGTYLSGPSGLSGGEAEHLPNTQYPSGNQDIQMSKYLSPQKPMGDQRISVSNAVNNALESRQGMNNFGQDPYQNSYDNNQGRYQSTNYGRSTSMPHHYMS